MHPTEPIILFSIVNMWLRDKYRDFDAMEDDLGNEAIEIKEILEKAGFFYDINTNRFVEK